MNDLVLPLLSWETVNFRLSNESTFDINRFFGRIHWQNISKPNFMHDFLKRWFKNVGAEHIIVSLAHLIQLDSLSVPAKSISKPEAF